MRAFFRHFSWLFAGHATFVASQGLMLVVLAKLGSPQYVGSFALALAITGPLILFTGMNQRGILAAAGTPDHRFGDHLTLRLIMLGAAFLIIVGIAASGLMGATTALTLVFVGLARVFWGLSDVHYGLFLSHDHNATIAGSLILRSVLGVAGLAGGLVMTGDLVVASAGMAAGWAVPLLVVDLPSAHRRIIALAEDPSQFRASRDLRRVGRLFRVTLPLGFAVALVSLNTHIPKYVVGFFLGADDLGYYAALATLVVAGTTVVNVLGQTALPRLARRYQAGDTRGFLSVIARLGALAFGVGVAGLALALVAGGPIISFIYTPAYGARLDVLYWVIVGAAFAYVAWMLDAALTSMGRFGVQAVGTAVGCVAAALLAVALVRTGGLVAIAQAWAASAFLIVGFKVAAMVLVLRDSPAARTAALVRGPSGEFRNES